VLATCPENPDPAWVAARASVLAELDRIEEAGAILGRLRQDFPAVPAGFVGLANLAMRQRRWTEALERWDDVLGRFDDPAGRPFWDSARASVLRELGQSAAAETVLRKVVAAHPGFFNPLWNLLNLMVLAGGPGEALDTLETSAFRDIAMPLLLAMRCRILVRLHRLADARLVFMQTVEAADDVLPIEHLFALVAQLYEGWRRTEAWLALHAKLDGLTYPAHPADAAPFETLRARLRLALRDHVGFLAAADRIEPPHHGRSGEALYAVALALRDPAYADWRKPKIFGIGLSRTGTMTVAAALGALGLPTLHWHNPLTLVPMTDDDLYVFAAFMDTPVCLAFEKYYYLFPNSKFIYTTRPTDTWLSSMERHWEKDFGLSGFAAIREAFSRPDSIRYGIGFRDLNVALFLNHPDFAEAYRAYDRRVRRFFEDKPKNRFLEFDVFRGDGWRELCGFLGHEIPTIAFPWENRGLPERSLGG
jgi:hypothetical protein